MQLEVTLQLIGSDTGEEKRGVRGTQSTRGAAGSYPPANGLEDEAGLPMCSSRAGLDWRE